MKTNIGFIGAGNMGAALIRGIQDSSMAENFDLYVTDIDTMKLMLLKPLGVKFCEDNKAVVRKCKFVFLAVKPQMFEELLLDIGDAINDETVLISIAAGITGEYIQTMTKKNVKIALAMPNTPLLLGEGATALSKVEPITDIEFHVICNIFAACGKTEIIQKEKMHEVIPINGSSPAFIYLFAKGFVDYGKSVGIKEDVARSLFAQALIGSAKMITDSGKSIDELIRMVSSPGGTTLKGLEAFNEGKLLELIDKACKKTTERAYELSK